MMLPGLFICVKCSEVVKDIPHDEIFHAENGRICGQWCKTTERKQMKLV